MISVPNFFGSGVRHTFFKLGFQVSSGTALLSLMMSRPEVRMLGADDKDFLAASVKKLDDEGLTEARHLALQARDGGPTLLEACFIDRTWRFSDDVVAVVEGFLETMASRAKWSEKLQAQGRDPRIVDVLEALGKVKKRDREDEYVAGGTADGALRLQVRVTCARNAAGASRLSEVDRLCYDRWAKRTTDLLREADVPSWTLVKDTVDPEKTLKGILGRSQAGTVRLRVRPWEAFTRWLMWRRERRWPTSAVDVVDYVAEKMSEAPAASFPRSFGASLVWL